MQRNRRRKEFSEALLVGQSLLLLRSYFRVDGMVLMPWYSLLPSAKNENQDNKKYGGNVKT